jgi:trehalose 6-phosphate phosphatase
LKQLFSGWSTIIKQFKEVKHVMLFTDFDGTLTPIVDKPELAMLDEKTKGLLQKLACDPKFTVGIISGRALDDLKEKVNINGIIYSGNHGLEIQGPGTNLISPMAVELKPILRVINHVLNQSLNTIRGVFIEDKGLSLCVHFRLVEEKKAREVERIVRRLVSLIETKKQTKVTKGKKILEIKPAVNWDKGKAIKLLMHAYAKGSQEDFLPMYFGDDITDYDGFRVIEGYKNGISVFLGENNKRRPVARYYLRSPNEMVSFLDLLVKQARTGFNSALSPK